MLKLDTSMTKICSQPGILSCILGLVLATAGASAKDLSDTSLEEVLQAILEANGGKETVEGLTNVRLLGELIQDGESSEFVILKKRPNKARMRIFMPNGSIESGFNGSIGWRRHERGGHDKVIPMDESNLAAARRYADFDGPLVGPVPEVMTRKLVGVERIDRVDYFVIEVIYPDSKSLHYIDSRTYRERKSISTVTDDKGQVSEVVSHYSDLKKHAGIWVSHHLERKSSNGSIETILVHQVDMNPGILDMVFEMPKERNPIPEN